MRNITRSLVLGGALLAVAGAANAQTTLVDSIGTSPGTSLGWDTGSTNSRTQQYVGWDTGNANTAVPSSPANSGYVFQPFTLTSLETIGEVDVVGKVFNPAAGTGGTFSSTMYAAFIPATTTVSSSTTTVGGFFTLTTTSTAGAATVFSATGLSQTLAPGSYDLVYAPYAGFNPSAQPSTSLLQYGAIEYEATTGGVNLTKSGGSITGPGAVLGQASFNDGASGSLNTLSVTSNPAYTGVRLITAIAGVPEGSTLITALLGLAPIGGLLLRRRRNVK